MTVTGCGATAPTSTAPNSAASNSAASNSTTAEQTTTEVSAFERDRRAGVEDLLDRWATALRAADHDGIRDLIDPAASPQFVDEQLARADALTAVDFDSFSYAIVDSPEIPVPPPIAAGVSATDLWAPDIRLDYAIAGSDAAPAALPVAPVVTRHGDRWYLLSDSALDDYGRRTHPAPWDFGPVVVERVPAPGSDGEVSTIIGHADRQAEIDALAAQLTTAVPAVTDMWGTDWAQRAVVFVASTPEEFDGLVSGGDGSTDASLAAATITDPITPGTAPTGQRIVFGPRAADEFTDRSRATVLRHELTHVAARSATGEGAPLWLLEGFADYTAYRGRGFDFAEIAPTLRGVVREHGAPTVLPNDAAFGAGGTAAALAYESAWSVADYVAQRYSEASLLDLYRSLARGPLDPAVFDATLERLFGTTARGFVADWGARVAAEAAIGN
ncbi:hypothetical protein [Millisia brevis]|uniref:hypothetical protein n=1 Tax=Millisia brevis TaxID=264148 RepID=UPI0012ED5163|nr:hypothetical protein [Millisia brevis]